MGRAILFNQPAIFQNFEKLVVGESKRHGGVSSEPFHSLNLGRNTKDNYKNVTENLRRLFSTLKILPDQIVSSVQVHDNQVFEAILSGSVIGYDAIISQQKNLFLTITVADCTPVLVYDAKQKAVAAIHAGWKGTTRQIVSKTLLEMSKKYGSLGADCYAYVGTCIDQASFEVDEDVALHFSEDYKYWDAQRQKYFIDLKAANTSQLKAFGIPDQQIEVSPYSTVRHNDDYFSYRKEKGQTGRMLAWIGMRASPLV